MASPAQMEGGFIKRQVMQRRPQVEYITVRATVSLEALKSVFAQMGGEGRLSVTCRAVDRAGTAALTAAATP